MEIKKRYVEPVLREKPISLEIAFTVSGSLEDGNVLQYDDDFWS